MTDKPQTTELTMTDEQIQQWIDACNHEPARQTLRDYLALRKTDITESRTTNIDTRSRLLASEVWHAMQTAPKYIDGQSVGNCEALKEGAKIIRGALQSAFEDGVQAEFKRVNK